MPALISPIPLPKLCQGIECDGPRAFSVEMPCLRYNGFRYANILLFSIFLGFLGIDRLCMCQVGLGWSAGC